MFERFTDRARQVIVLAQDECRLHKHEEITTGHLLMGLVREHEGIGSRVLARANVSEDRARAALVKHLPPGDADVDGQVPFTKAAKKVLEDTLREALSLGHRYIATEHILLALDRTDEWAEARKMLDETYESATGIRGSVNAVLIGTSGRTLTGADPKPPNPRFREVGVYRGTVVNIEDGERLADTFTVMANTFEAARVMVMEVAQQEYPSMTFEIEALERTGTVWSSARWERDRA